MKFTTKTLIILAAIAVAAYLIWQKTKQAPPAAGNTPGTNTTPPTKATPPTKTKPALPSNPKASDSLFTDMETKPKAR